MLTGGLQRSRQINAGDPTFGPHPPLTNALPAHRPPPLVGPVGPVVFLVHFAPDCGRFATFVKLVAYLYICISL